MGVTLSRLPCRIFFEQDPLPPSSFGNCLPVKGLALDRRSFLNEARCQRQDYYLQDSCVTRRIEAHNSNALPSKRLVCRTIGRRKTENVGSAADAGNKGSSSSQHPRNQRNAAPRRAERRNHRRNHGTAGRWVPLRLDFNENLHSRCARNICQARDASPPENIRLARCPCAREEEAALRRRSILSTDKACLLWF